MSLVIVNEEKLMSKLRWKLIPYLFLFFILAMVDRVNISFAALQMNKDLGISASAFGMIAGIFFIAYFVFEVPSNVLMHKFGARIWICRILISWGLVTLVTAFAESVTHLVVLRCLLGVAEAGFYPCIILYFTYWFPVRHQARTISIFMCAMLIANIVAGPISTLVMDNISWFNIMNFMIQNYNIGLYSGFPHQSQTDLIFFVIPGLITKVSIDLNCYFIKKKTTKPNLFFQVKIASNKI